MTRLAFFLCAILLAVCATQVQAKDDPALTRAVMHLRAVPAALKPDRGYILLRTSTAKSGLFPINHVLLRVPSEQESKDYFDARQRAYAAALPKLTKEAKGGVVTPVEQFAFAYDDVVNTFVVRSGEFLQDGEMRTILLDVMPGTYVLYGTTLGNRGMVTCNCLGTVSFAVKAGNITDIGSLYADKVHKDSPIPNLEDNLGEQMFQYGFIFGAAVVPAVAGTPAPTMLAQLPREIAEFEVVPAFYNYGPGTINRLAPIPGLLHYQRGRPVDLRKTAN